MEFRIARAAHKTGELLESIVRETLAAENIPEPDCVVCYGVGYSGPKPALNAKCNQMNKMEQGITIHEALPNQALSIETVPAEKWPTVPCIARKIKHAKGKDILVCRTHGAIIRALERGRQYFTPLVESDTEFRVWVYRKRVLAVYEKQLTEPEKNTKFGRNRANGFTFHALENERVFESVRSVAVTAVRCLGLDFGAVDILGKWDASQSQLHPTVLEVNTAPGVSDEHRHSFARLAHRIVRWCANGCPSREETPA